MITKPIEGGKKHSLVVKLVAAHNTSKPKATRIEYCLGQGHATVMLKAFTAKWGKAMYTGEKEGCQKIPQAYCKYEINL